MKTLKVQTQIDSKRKNNYWDIIGISASAVCAVHCLFLPVLFPFLASLGIGLTMSEHFEHILILGTILMALSSVTHSYIKIHHKIYPYIFLLIGTLILYSKNRFGEQSEPYIVVVGLILIASTYALNRYLCKNCKVCKSGRS